MSEGTLKDAILRTVALIQKHGVERPMWLVVRPKQAEELRRMVERAAGREKARRKAAKKRKVSR